MADWNNHYERAFAAHLRARRAPCIAVDESRRAMASGPSIKSLDFIVAFPGGPALLIDIKGRRVGGKRRSLENWAFEDDVVSLNRWERLFGGGGRGLLVFVYHLLGEREASRFRDRFDYGDRQYGCLAVAAADYGRHMRTRSPSWKTVSLPQATFAELSRPVSHWLQGVEQCQSFDGFDEEF